MCAQAGSKHGKYRTEAIISIALCKLGAGSCDSAIVAVFDSTCPGRVTSSLAGLELGTAGLHDDPCAGPCLPTERIPAFFIYLYFFLLVLLIAEIFFADFAIVFLFPGPARYCLVNVVRCLNELMFD